MHFFGSIAVVRALDCSGTVSDRGHHLVGVCDGWPRNNLVVKLRLSCEPLTSSGLHVI